MAVALKMIVKHTSKAVIIAVPVLPYEELARFQEQVDDVVYLSAPAYSEAIGAFYTDFTQVTDDEVVMLLHKKTL